MIPCKKKSCNAKEDELHHIVPKCIGGTDKDGRVYLCKKHHDIISKMTLSWLWKVRNQPTQKIHQHFKKMTKWWLNK